MYAGYELEGGQLVEKNKDLGQMKSKMTAKQKEVSNIMKSLANLGLMGSQVGKIGDAGIAGASLGKVGGAAKAGAQSIKGGIKGAAKIGAVKLKSMGDSAPDKPSIPDKPTRKPMSEAKDKKGKGSGTKDACYHKVKSRYSVWPSAYASGALVKCRKVGAANWGNSSKKEAFSDWKSEFIWEDGDSSKKISELDRLKNAIKTGMMDGKKLSPKELEGIKAGLTQGGNKIDEGLMDSIKDVGKKVIKKTKEFINKPIIRDYPTKKEYEDSVKSGTSSKYESIEYQKSDWRDELGEDWQKTNRQDKTDGMSQKAVNAYKRENPGSKLKTAVTQKPSTLKRGSKKSKRRKSFCSRMKGMKKRLTSAKTARDPDSRINKALRRWNC